MLKETSQVITDAVNRTLEVLRKHTRGDLIPWHVVEAAAGFERYSQHWSAYFKRLRREFLEGTGIFLYCPGDNRGLKLLTTKEQLTEQVTRRERKALKQYTRSKKETLAVNNAELSMHEIQVKARQLESIRRARKAALTELNKSHQETRTISSPWRESFAARRVTENVSGESPGV